MVCACTKKQTDWQKYLGKYWTGVPGCWYHIDPVVVGRDIWWMRNDSRLGHGPKINQQDSVISLQLLQNYTIFTNPGCECRWLADDCCWIAEIRVHLFRLGLAIVPLCVPWHRRPPSMNTGAPWPVRNFLTCALLRKILLSLWPLAYAPARDETQWIKFIFKLTVYSILFRSVKYLY